MSFSLHRTSGGISMKKITTSVIDCYIIEPRIFSDDRGTFCEIYKDSYIEPLSSAQCNYSYSKKGVLRGIHRTPYSKYVTCVSGKVFDVCLDLRQDSQTYKKYFGIELTPAKMSSLYIPPYCGHGFLALEDSILIYQQSQEYNSKVDEAYCWKDLNIEWPINPSIISEKDKNSCSD